MKNEPCLSEAEIRVENMTRLAKDIGSELPRLVKPARSIGRRSGKPAPVGPQIRFERIAMFYVNVWLAVKNPEDVSKVAELLTEISRITCKETTL